ncbi:MAG: DNA mismatch repair endonuclease MutL [Acidobacteriota bacterium]
MPSIQLLDDRLVSQIAAGEVVERPASVVKELVENSLDAGAREVEIELESGGKRRIVVVDDGRGMDADDALLAFDRHATSKIARFEDLERVGTLGFRGEALASIAAVARVELRTAAEAGDGRRVRIEGGRMLGVEPVTQPRGSRFEVASLFFNVPARRKFLKRPQTELRRCLEVVQGYALAHPEVRFVVRHAERTLLEAPPAAGENHLERRRERIAQVFGRELADALGSFADEDEAASQRIEGFLGDRSTGGARRIFLFVNRRLVRDRALLARFYRAVRDVWHHEDYPALFLSLELAPEDVDVNVHPQKAEVRFREPRTIDRVEDVLRSALDAQRSRGSASLAAPRSLPEVPAAWEGLGGRRRDGEAWRRAEELRQQVPEPNWTPEVSPDQPLAVAAPARPMPPPPGIARPTFRPVEASTSPLGGRGKTTLPFRLLGQYKGSVILLEGHDGLYLIDQHAAHERLLYERMRRTLLDGLPQAQALVTPVVLELSAAESLHLRELIPALETCGFSLTPMAGDTIGLVAIPTPLGLEVAEAILRGLAADPEATGSDAEALRRRILDELAADMSCRAAIKIHRPMQIEEMEALVSELFEAEQPYACPHGRPTVLHLGDTEMERRFGRRG